MEETKVIYYVDDEETPYMMKIPLSPSKVTLSDLKGQLNRPFKKFFFKSIDDDIGWVREIGCILVKATLTGVDSNLLLF